MAAAGGTGIAQGILMTHVETRNLFLRLPAAPTGTARKGECVGSLALDASIAPAATAADWTAETPKRDVARLPGRPKILLYSHDTFGLGNIRRTLVLAETLSAAYPDGAVLIVTGSPVIQSFRIPDGVDYIKLPSIDRVAAERYEARFLRRWDEEVRSTRSQLLKQAVLGFAPDLMVVDKRPGGIDGELLECLEAARKGARPPRLVLGMRDILDSPERSHAVLEDSGSFDLIRRYYDEVWIYGDRKLFDATEEYGFPNDIRRITRFCGYLGRAVPRVPSKQGPKRVVVATGGGGDGSPMIATYLEGLREMAEEVDFRTTVVLGPEMPGERRDELLGRYGHLADVEFCDFDPEPLERYAQANVVVSMAGYNTICELLSVDRPAVLVPRFEPVQEQLIRARRLARHGGFDVVEPGELRPRTLIEKVMRLLRRPDVPLWRPSMGALPIIRARVAALIETRER